MRRITFCWPLLVSFMLLSCGGEETEQTQTEQPPEPATTQITTAETEEMQGRAEEDTVEEEPEPIQVVETEEGRFTVQVSSWRTRQAAERDAQRFRNHGYDAYVQEAYLADRGETWYRVRIGRFTTKEEGHQLANDLTQLLEDGYWLDSYRAEK